MEPLIPKILTLNDALKNAQLPFGFGGAIALAFCIDRPRATADLDVNVFVGVNEVDKLVKILPNQIALSPKNIKTFKAIGQVRLFWGDAPIDIFINTHEFHTSVAKRTYEVDFAGSRIPVLSCGDLTVFKVFFGRTKDWADIEEIIRSHSIDPSKVFKQLCQLLGADNENVKTFRIVLQKVIG